MKKLFLGIVVMAVATSFACAAHCTGHKTCQKNMKSKPVCQNSKKILLKGSSNCVKKACPMAK